MMKSGRRILSGLIATALVATLAVPALAAEQTMTEQQQQYETTSFDDLEDAAWAKDYIMLCVQNKAITGVRDADANGVSSFKPNSNVTLGQFLTVVTRLVAPDKIQGEGSHWATPNYNAAIQSGIIRSSDFSGSEASLNKALSRADMAYILVGAAKANGETLEILPNVENMMKDYSSIDYTRQDAVKRAYSNALLAGDTNGNFNPNGLMTRAQMATVVCRLMEYSPRGTVTVPDSNTQTPGDRVTQGGYVSNVGETKGMLLSKYSREYEHKALQAVRTGSDAKGVFVTFTAPQLPAEIKDSFTYDFAAIVYKSNGDYFADNLRVSLNSGESKTLYFNSFDGSSVSKSDIGSMTIGVSISNAEGKSMFSRSIENTDKTSTYGVWFNSKVDKTSLDCSAVWTGIGK